MSALTYERLIDELFPRLTGGVRWGLERTEALLESVAHPERSYATIHVGGTNGKGSVSATIAGVLRAQGRRTALYSSPHLCTFRERVQIDGAPISRMALVQNAELLWEQIQALQPSFFEATTALAFLAFRTARAEIAVVEVGLGGRLDSTNVISPLVTVLTNVALDHAQLLGSTLPEIAQEKAGIIKRGVPVVTAERNPEIRDLFAARAAALDAPFFEAAVPSDVGFDASGTRFTVDTRAWGRLQLHTPLIGTHQAMNAALAVQALELLPDAWRPGRAAVLEGVAQVRWPGRMQIEQRSGTTWVFDVAHNPAGVHALVATLDALELPRPLCTVVGILGDKDWASMLPPLAERSDALFLTTAPSVPAGREWSLGEAEAVTGGRARTVSTLRDALGVAAAAAGTGTVLVTGSFHTVGDSLIELGLAPFGSDA